MPCQLQRRSILTSPRRAWAQGPPSRLRLRLKSLCLCLCSCVFLHFCRHPPPTSLCSTVYHHAQLRVKRSKCNPVQSNPIQSLRLLLLLPHPLPPNKLHHRIQHTTPPPRACWPCANPRSRSWTLRASRADSTRLFHLLDCALRV